MSDITPSTKRCKQCNEDYPRTAEFWHRDKGAPDGFTYTCKTCAKNRSKNWVGDNTERNKENCKRYYHENPDKVQEYKETHVEQIAATKRQYRKEHPEATKKHKSESAKRNRSHLNEYNRKWNKLHPETGRVVLQRRLARKKALPNVYTKTQWLACLDWWKRSCAYCGNPLEDGKRTHMDHFIPLTAIGCPGTVLTNIVPACVSCNSSKGNTDPYRWTQSKFPTTFGGILYRIESYFDSLEIGT